MIKHIASVAGVGVAVAFVVVFFVGRTGTKEIGDIAPRVGMSAEELLAIGPRVASQTGATLGSSRRVVYLLACSGKTDRTSLEEQATLASHLARKQSLSDREAVIAILAQRAAGGGASSLEGC